MLYLVVDIVFLLDQSIYTLNKCSSGFPLLFTKCFGLALFPKIKLTNDDGFDFFQCFYVGLPSPLDPINMSCWSERSL